jgi:NADH-quinone oxidoreductase subunit N
VLAGYRKGDRKAAEASLKYVIYGGVASGVMVFGMSWLYGLLGTTNVLEFAQRLQALPQTGAVRVALVLAVVFVSAGVGYKIAAVPWHMWCPDVYEGAPTPFTAFLSVGPKAAGFALALRLFWGALAGPAAADGFAEAVGGVPWPAVIGVLAAVTMTLGNFTAIVQTNLKRLLAYSSIAHAGYVLMGVISMQEAGFTSAVYYALAYLIMNFTVFMVLSEVASDGRDLKIAELAGLWRRSPLLSMSLILGIFALAGVPPSIGFTGKLLLFTSAMNSGFFWLVLIGAVNGTLSLYYYLKVVYAAYFVESDLPPIELSLSSKVLNYALCATILVFGVAPNSIIELARAAVKSVL